MGLVGKAAKAGDLLGLARRVGRRQSVLGLQDANRLGAAEAFGEHVDQRSVDVVDRSAISPELFMRIGNTLEAGCYGIVGILILHLSLTSSCRGRVSHRHPS